MNELNLKGITEEKLEYGISLRESTDFIKGHATVEYEDGTNPQWVHVDIPPGKINSEGYVEEVWVASDSVFIHREVINEVEYSLIHPNWLVSFNGARITSIKIDDQKLGLLPSPNKFIVRYRMPK